MALAVYNERILIYILKLFCYLYAQHLCLNIFFNAKLFDFSLSYL